MSRLERWLHERISHSFYRWRGNRLRCPECMELIQDFRK